jgi:hypothetical protein
LYKESVGQFYEQPEPGSSQEWHNPLPKRRRKTRGTVWINLSKQSISNIENNPQASPFQGRKITHRKEENGKQMGI